MNQNKEILKAMFLLAKSLSFSSTYKKVLIDEIAEMIEVENSKFN